jgi:hypothetical protein
LQWKMLVYLWPFCLYYGHLAFLWPFGNSVPIWCMFACFGIIL